ncbi:MAG: hypothetical protein GW795_11305 [Cyanobacteria bacterium]|nr:hypothetical protein [Cyanobacteria bacterium CG_2015-16_32_12]NCO77108.1 hypothetical protein [Cyanobacteria bacterium CG_2015-22_32_23]NCQ03949.1 hypothetical protein [Cyanobacteria bacterium CG_2015-09_32_10]NCQ42443.1 hypothetical protein [Cyanobacteria bacterium CG_2015-04_32_10]NCS85979.1 hypothetical protein [Cyanobacteria bacterium CG_2015-02_32_10]
MTINNFSLVTIIKNKLIDLITKEKKQLQYFTDLSRMNFSIELSKNGDNIIYKTSLCLPLAKIYKKSPLFLAQNLVNIFNQSSYQQDILIQISRNGWLEFIIGDRLVNEWLNKVNKINLLELNKDNIKTNKSQINFNNYYTHSRCCSILKSAHQQNIINLNSVDFILNKWYIEKPVNIKYEIINLSGSYEQKLIKELIIITDKIVNNKLNYQNSLNKLSKAILDVECYCQIWGETLHNHLAISQSRLGLIAIALNYYQNLFYQEFKENLPTEI